jgi:hypothetical protein
MSTPEKLWTVTTRERRFDGFVVHESGSGWEARVVVDEIEHYRRVHLSRADAVNDLERQRTVIQQGSHAK